MSNLRRVYFLLLAALSLAGLAVAQTGTGTVKGVLTDDSGAVIPAANINLTSPAGTKTAQTQADGSYTFSGITPGNYNVNVTFPGFAPLVKPVTVVAGQTATVAAQLSIVAEKQEVTVKAETMTTISVEPDNNAGALVLKGDDLASLPDDPDDLSDALQALAGPGAGPNGGSIYIDGFSGGQFPPKESIREIRINQNPFSAEFDKIGFGRIEIFTKPGTDHFRGSIGLNAGDGIFNSRNPFENNKPDFSQRMWHATISGPLSKKASFSFDFNRRDQTDNAISLARYVLPSDPTTILNFNTAIVTPNVNTTFMPRIDYQISTNHSLTVRVEERLSSRENSGLGGTNLPPPLSTKGVNSDGNSQNATATETWIVNPKIVNETRFQYTRNANFSYGNLFPTISVSGAFSSGGSDTGTPITGSKHFELQNYTSVLHGTHTIKFGVRARRDSDTSFSQGGYGGSFSFLGGIEPVLTANNTIATDANGNPVTTLLQSIAQYQRFLTLQNAGFTIPQIQALGGGPSRFSISGGNPYISGVRYDAGPFFQDDIRVKPNFTLSLGARYEVQSLLSDYKDVAPRLGFAWAPGANAKSRQQKTVIRGGFGMFYDRVGSGVYENARQLNGSYQVSYNVSNPTFYLNNIPALSTLTPSSNSLFVVDPKLRAEYLMQSAIGVERQLPHLSRVSVTYTNTRGEHLDQSVPINAPLPGTYIPGNLNTGVRPYGNIGNITEYESGGILRQNLVIVSFSSQINRRISFQGNYSLNYAKDLPSSPMDPYNFALDYGRSNLDQRHNLTLSGSIVGPKNIRFAPNVVLRTGSPYNVTVGTDYYNTLGFSGRPAFAPACGPSDVVCTSVGNFITDPVPGVAGNLVPRDYLTSAGLISINSRVYRTWGFGPRRGGNADNGGGMGGPGGPGGFGPGGGGPGGGGGGRGGGGGGGARGGGGGMRMGGGGGGGRGGGALTEKRFNLTLAATVSNIPNHFNPSGYVGTITSPLFLQPTGANTSFAGGGAGGRGGGGSSANNRRIDMSVTFNF